jgi:hypothetical protein
MNGTMKCLLVDYTNEGVLFVSSRTEVINYLKKGLVDTTSRAVWPWHNEYNELKYGLQDVDRFINHANGKLYELQEAAQNPAYLERKRLTAVRSKAMEKLMIDVEHASRSSKISVWEGFENNLQNYVDSCDPSNNIWHKRIIEYSRICKLEPFVAYRELVLELESAQSLKMRLYAWMRFYANSINECQTDKDIEKILNDMLNTFRRDIAL